MKLPEKKKRRAWFPWLVIGLLGTHVGGMLLAVKVATGDRTFIAIPDYYGKSIRWDQSKEEAKQSAALGWKRTVTVSSPDQKGQRTLRVTLVDREGASIALAQAEAVVFPELFPNRTSKIALIEKAPGTYEATVIADPASPLVIDLRATVKASVFVSRATLLLGSGS